MNKTQTKIEAGRYVAPQVTEHALTLKSRILDGSDVYSNLGQLNDNEEE